MRFLTSDERKIIVFLVVFLGIGILIVNAQNIIKTVNSQNDPAVQDSIKKIIEQSYTHKKININEADIETLAELPGIGPQKAKAIFEYQEEHGAFASLAELTNVKGIGEKTLEKLLPYFVPIGDSTEVITVSDKKDITTASTKINLNTASAEELASVPGIGESKAQSIIEYRNQHGGFKTIEKIKEVKGIGEKTYENIKDKIEVK